MIRVVLLTVVLLLSAAPSFAQFTFDRPKTEGLLPNPYTAAAARDVIVEAVLAMIKDSNIDIDEEKSKKEEGILVTKPVIFTKGTVTVSQLEHFSHCPVIDARNWTRGRYTLQVLIEAIDPSHAKIGISTKIEGENQGVLGSQWIECRSKGVMEDQILRTVVERIK